MMTSVPTLHAGNLTWPHGTDKGEEALDYNIMDGLSASSVLPPESFLDLQSTRSPAVVPHPFPEGGWVVGVGVERAWQDILVLVLKGLVMSAVIIASVLGNLLVIVSVARYVPSVSSHRSAPFISDSSPSIETQSHPPRLASPQHHPSLFAASPQSSTLLSPTQHPKPLAPPPVIRFGHHLHNKHHHPYSPLRSSFITTTHHHHRALTSLSISCLFHHHPYQKQH